VPGAPIARADGAAGWKPWTGWAAVVVNVGIIAGARSIIRPGGDPRLGVVIALIFLTLAPVGLVILLAKWHGTTTASGFKYIERRLTDWGAAQPNAEHRHD